MFRTELTFFEVFFKVFFEVAEMATNYRDDFFGIIRVPTLKSIGRSEVREFLDRYEKYVRLVQERARLVNEDPQIIAQDSGKV